MIFIKESFPDENSVMLKVDGTLDYESIPILKNICEIHSKLNRKISLNLEGLIHISREGSDFLQELQNKFYFINIPLFIELKN
jgi:hypothetical protein